MRLLLIIVFINLVIKAIPAGILELGNDEVYYWTYALFPDWSHFDHPPMVGLLIQLSTVNLALTGEIFVRAGSLLLSSGDIIILFLIVRRLFSVRAAFISVLMFISSFYFNVISGLFILPDSPQIFFILLGLYFLLPSVTIKNPDRKDALNIILFGVFTGLALLSKYHSLFLWFGAGLYILLRNRIWLKKPSLYISVIITLTFSIPIIYWNYKNDFISFTFHGNRLGLLHSPLNPVSFIQFNLGQFFYNNPVLFLAILVALFKTIRKKKPRISEIEAALLYQGLPLILVFVFISLFRTVLPHWSGPAFICLIIFTSKYLDGIYETRRKSVIRLLASAVGMFVLVIILGVVQIKTGFIKITADASSVYRGNNDFTLDMYGWKQARKKFEDFLERENISPGKNRNPEIVSDNWFPAAHLDFYIASPLNIRLFALGNIGKIHKYFWINKARKLDKSARIFYITDSRNYQSPEKFRKCFSEIIPLDTLPITRSGKIVKYIFLYDMIGLKCDTVLYSPDPGF